MLSDPDNLPGVRPQEVHQVVFRPEQLQVCPALSAPLRYVYSLGPWPSSWFILQSSYEQNIATITQHRPVNQSCAKSSECGTSEPTFHVCDCLTTAGRTE